MSKIPKVFIFLFWAWGYLMLSQKASAADWYVSRSGSNADGASWSTAWNELNQIQWASVNPGDIIYIDGGEVSMRYDTMLTVGKGGTSGNRITVARSAEPDHDGIVYFSEKVYVDYPYVTIDGGDRSKFILDYDGTGYIVRNPPNGDFFEFRNATIDTFFTGTALWGTPFYSNSPNVLVSRCHFDDTNEEDQIKYNGTDGTIIIEDSLFTGLTQHGLIHEDIVQFDTSGCNLIARRNFFLGNQTDCFMINTGTALGNLEFYYNVFSQNSDAIKMYSAASVTAYNNTFHGCRDILMNVASPTDSRNNLYTGRSIWDGPIHISSSSYSLNDLNTDYFTAGNNNLQADPLLADKVNRDYSLLPGSPAIDAGTDLGFTTDIVGNPIVGAPDIGAFEYYSGADVTAPSAPSGLNVI